MEPAPDLRLQLRRRLRATTLSFARDLDAMTASLRGRAPAPFSPRDGRAWPLEPGGRSAAPPVRTIAAALVDRSRLPATAQPVTYRLAGGAQVVQVQPGQTLLSAARAAGLDLPFSCTLGGCGACRQHKVGGEVLMRRPNCLNAQEEARGDILLCISHPLGPVEVEIASEVASSRLGGR